ncbi:uridylate-specific endoribonuclease B-like [Haliotis rufescens]|uniref:uridylate-specific endoribonuclease B-like n=1 Tax=Haliotis rufescens TaxID=6454 RepID=UPI00201F3C11|nr:uridylate-specific endoribonuclease B-like [Haliotis rufescens]
MAYYQDDSAFEADGDLSDAISKLWELDDNKCYPGQQYEVDLQGYVTSSRRVNKDFARDKLISWFDEEEIFSRPTYKAFKDLLDNYELERGEVEVVTWEERKENWEFLSLIVETPVMQEAQRILVERGKAPEDTEDFKKLLHDIWFKMYHRRGGRGPDSCSFEHVFVGEGRGDEFIGLHNWLQFYLQEKAGNINYHGFFRRETLTDDEIPRLIALQFSWKGIKSKPMCSCFLGTSPEFEIAVYTMCLLLDKDGKTDCQMGEYEVEIVVHSHGFKKKLGTAYIAAARLY